MSSLDPLSYYTKTSKTEKSHKLKGLFDSIKTFHHSVDNLLHVIDGKDNNLKMALCFQTILMGYKEENPLVEEVATYIHGNFIECVELCFKQFPNPRREIWVEAFTTLSNIPMSIRKYPEDFKYFFLSIKNRSEQMRELTRINRRSHEFDAPAMGQYSADVMRAISVLKHDAKMDQTLDVSIHRQPWIELAQISLKWPLNKRTVEDLNSTLQRGFSETRVSTNSFAFTDLITSYKALVEAASEDVNSMGPMGDHPSSLMASKKVYDI